MYKQKIGHINIFSPLVHRALPWLLLLLLSGENNAEGTTGLRFEFFALPTTSNNIYKIMKRLSVD